MKAKMIAGTRPCVSRPFQKPPRLGPAIALGEAYRKSGLTGEAFMQAIRDLERLGLVKSYQDYTRMFHPHVLARVLDVPEVPPTPVPE